MDILFGMIIGIVVSIYLFCQSFASAGFKKGYEFGQKDAISNQKICYERLESSVSGSVWHEFSGCVPEEYPTNSYLEESD